MRHLFLAVIVLTLCGCNTSPPPEAVVQTPTAEVLYFDAGDYSPSHGMLTTLMDVLDGRPEKVHLQQVNTEQSSELMSIHDVTAVPTLIILQDGEEAGRLVGRTSHPQLDNFFHRTLL